MPTIGSLGGRLGPELRQIVRIVIAGCISWQVCIWIGSAAPPIFAVIVPVVAMHEQPYSALNVSLARLVGVVGGIGLGVLLVRCLGPSLVAIGVVLTAGLLAGVALRLGGALNIQVAVSALLVFASADPDSYAAARVWETAVGVAVTVLLAPFIFPADPLGTFRHELAQLAARLAGHLAAASALAAEPIYDQQRAADLRRELRATEARSAQLPGELDQARRATRFSPLRRRTRPLLGRLEPVTRLSETLGRHERQLVDELSELAAREDIRASWQHTRLPLSRTLSALAESVESTLLTAESRASHPARTALIAADKELMSWRASRDASIEAVLRRPLRRVERDLHAFLESVDPDSWGSTAGRP